MKSISHGRVYRWIPDAANRLGGRVTAGTAPLPRLDTTGEGRGRLWGRHVRVKNGGEINEPSNGRVRIVPIGDARPNAAGDFFFEPGRGGGRIDKVVCLGASSLPAEFIESGVP